MWAGNLGEISAELDWSFGRSHYPMSPLCDARKEVLTCVNVNVFVKHPDNLYTQRCVNDKYVT